MEKREKELEDFDGFFPDENTEMTAAENLLRNIWHNLILGGNPETLQWKVDVTKRLIKNYFEKNRT